jgi:hypothetical protein
VLLIASCDLVGKMGQMGKRAKSVEAGPRGLLRSEIEKSGSRRHVPS